jgi:hypothetical protein
MTILDSTRTSLPPSSRPDAGHERIDSVARALEMQLHSGPASRKAHLAGTPADLIPVVVAGEVRWHHDLRDPTGSAAGSATAMIADALDAALYDVRAARATWPDPRDALGQQLIALTSARALLHRAAEQLGAVMEMADAEGLALSVVVHRPCRPVGDEDTASDQAQATITIAD